MKKFRIEKDGIAQTIVVIDLNTKSEGDPVLLALTPYLNDGCECIELN